MEGPSRSPDLNPVDQDNALNPAVPLVENFLEGETIQRLEWPACSPDLNLIQHSWNSFGRHIRQVHCPCLLSGTWGLHSLKSGTVFPKVSPIISRILAK
ncbi:hypothetical protein TNCV_4509361 [Trichonephila clavipes]|nr:hypothetical protein TNCV_4509361 [Trichonephila clavipes]